MIAPTLLGFQRPGYSQRCGVRGDSVVSDPSAPWTSCHRSRTSCNVIVATSQSWSTPASASQSRPDANRSRSTQGQRRSNAAQGRPKPALDLGSRAAPALSEAARNGSNATGSWPEFGRHRASSCWMCTGPRYIGGSLQVEQGGWGGRKHGSESKQGVAPNVWPDSASQRSDFSLPHGRVFDATQPGLASQSSDSDETRCHRRRLMRRSRAGCS